MQPSELDILEIISSVGQARSFYIEAIQEAKVKIMRDAMSLCVKEMKCMRKVIGFINS